MAVVIKVLEEVSAPVYVAASYPMGDQDSIEGINVR